MTTTKKTIPEGATSSSNGVCAVELAIRVVVSLDDDVAREKTNFTAKIHALAYNVVEGGDVVELEGWRDSDGAVVGIERNHSDLLGLAKVT